MSLIRINSRPSSRQLLIFSLGFLCFAGGIAAHQWLKGRYTVAEICGGLGLLVPVVGLVWRECLRWVYLGLCYATYPLGYVVSTVVLVLFFYGVITPLGLLLRILHHDPLGKRSDPNNLSYWQPRERSRGPESYFKQY